eukprot:1151057-Pelagomonas_calceolata.AAC.4
METSITGSSHPGSLKKHLNFIQSFHALIVDIKVIETNPPQPGSVGTSAASPAYCMPQTHCTLAQIIPTVARLSPYTGDTAH